jgi:hypothetical protein
VKTKRLVGRVGRSTLPAASRPHTSATYEPSPNYFSFTVHGVMGDYFPVSRYYAGKAAFEKLGCKQLRESNPVVRSVCRDRTPPL